MWSSPATSFAYLTFRTAVWQASRRAYLHARAQILTAPHNVETAHLFIVLAVSPPYSVTPTGDLTSFDAARASGLPEPSQRPGDLLGTASRPRSQFEST